MNLLTNMGKINGTQLQVLVGPVLILMILAMMVLPLPPFILDFLFTFNIALSLMVLLVSMFTEKPLEFAAFPAILLYDLVAFVTQRRLNARCIDGRT